VIASVRGPVAARRHEGVVIECGGVGYALAVSAETLRHVPAAGEETLLHTHLVMRDDAIQLFGFASEQERAFFLMLVGVQSVGPKVALAVLSGGSPRELMRAIAAGDAARFQAVPGIGKRTAERIIVELREKVDGAAAASGGGEPGIGARAEDGDEPRAIARQGLVGLGFSTGEADDLLERTKGETPEDLIAGALRAAR
jgi:holliday junction DNA helicase RuvA